MVFSSTVFLFVFLPAVLIGYNLIRKELRNVFLLVMSLGFYAYGEPKFVFIMLLSIVVNYVSGLLISSFRGTIIFKRLFLFVALLCNLGILFYYKYFDFAVENINGIFKTDIALRNIVLPIGISFFTFQGMSYVIDLYLDKVKVQRKFINVALYIAFFPQLIAGPIVRYIDINEQIDSRNLSVEKFAEGVKRFIFGLAKKVIISNQVAIMADFVFDNSLSEVSVVLAWIGAICYTLQIYFDFSGYSDMAIGLGKMFGFDFLENFNYPYISRSITEFWRRWYISLSSWFRDYVYIPLGGNRKGNVYVNLGIVFLLTGIWHGASWNFILWGVWHGIFMLIERVFRKKEVKFKIPSVIKWIYTIFIVIIGWVLFRASDLSGALMYIKAMFGLNGNVFINRTAVFYAASEIRIIILGCIFSLPIYKKLVEISEVYVLPNKIGKIFMPFFMAALFIVSIAFTVTSTYNPFIYFNF